MATGKRTRAARRGAMYEASIHQMQAAGDYKGARVEAIRWLTEELAKVGRQRPHEAPEVDAAVTKQLMKLAASVPSYRPPKEAGHVPA
jgi:hypothetical protein